jgi:DNA-binding transcriptional LysR family regulator
MDVRKLRALLAVFETGSIAKAADRLHITQPGLTKTIQRFEDELGVTLFIRQPRGVLPTAYAEALRPYALSAVASLAQASKELRALRDGTEGTVAVASSPVIGGEILPEAIARLSLRQPNIRVRVALEPTESLPELVSESRFDFVIGVLGETLPQKTLKQRLLFYDKLVIVARPDHPLTKSLEVTAQDLAQQSWIVADEHSLNHRRLSQLFDAWDLPFPRVAVECRSPGVIKKLLLRTDHISLLAKLATEPEIGLRQLQTIEVTGANLDRPIGLLWSKNKALSSSSCALIAEISLVCQDRKFVTRPQIDARLGNSSTHNQ